MLCMYFVEHWFNLGDEACEDFLYNMPVARQFCQLDLGNEPIPDATKLENFRHPLERHKLDATIIAAPSSTKNADNARDPEMRSTKKGHQGRFGMKLHVGVDSKTGLLHSSTVTATNVPQSKRLHQPARLYKIWFDRRTAHEQSPQKLSALSRRTSIRVDQAHLGLYQSALPWLS
jgi:IS5 family transposase